MSKEESTKTAAMKGLSWRPVATWLLLPAIVLALFIRQQRIERDLDLGRKNSERQIESVREALSGLLQQDRLRYDDLDKQLQAISASAIRQVRPEVKTNRPEPGETFARKQDVVMQLSDLRSELRQDTALKLAQLSSDLQKTDSDLKRVVSQLDTTNARVENNSEELEERSVAAVPAARPEQEQVAQKKKKFWSKLNPFGRNKTAASDRNAVE